MKRTISAVILLFECYSVLSLCTAQQPDKGNVVEPRQKEERLVIHQPNNQPGHALGMTVCVNGAWTADCAQNPVTGNPVGVYIDISTTAEHLPVWALNPLCNVRGEADAECRVTEIDLNNWGSETVARSGPAAHGGDRLKMGLDVVTGGPVPSTCAYCEINAPGSGSWHYDVLLHRAIDASLGVNAPFVNRMRLTADVAVGLCVLRLDVGENYEVLRGMTATVDTGLAAEDVPIGIGDDAIREVEGRLQVRTLCQKAHRAGAGFTTYTARRGLDLSNAAYQATSVNLGSLYWQQRHGTHSNVNVAINDATNQEQVTESYAAVAGGIRHEFANLGGGTTFDGPVEAETVQTRRGTPKSSSEACHKGEMWSDAEYVYVCVAEHEIRRAVLARF